MKAVEQMNIFEKLSAITNELNRVAKNLQVGVGKSSYKAVGEADVLATVKPKEEQYRVYSYPFSRKVIKDEAFEVESSFQDQKTGKMKTTKKLSMFMRIETTYRFVNMDNPAEYIDIVTYGDGVDPQDKAPGKAMTYSDKYALLKAYKIETGDDPDQHQSGNMTRVAKAQKQQTSYDEIPTNEHLARLRELGGSINVVADFYKVGIEQVTDAMVVKMIEAKERSLSKAK